MRQNNTATNEQPTLTDLLATYRANLTRANEQSEQETLARVEKNITELCARIDRDLSFELRAALQLDIRRSVRYPSFGAVEAYFSIDGVPWSIMDDEVWVITGPRDYRRTCEQLNDEEVLSAITGYSSWLAGQQQQAAKPGRYTTPAGSDPRTCLLHRGAYVTVWLTDYFYQSKELGSAYWGTVEAWDKRWLLLTNDLNAQTLIAWRHVTTIEPREKNQPELEQPKAKHPHHYYNNVFSVGTTEQPPLSDEMTGDEIPF